MHVVTVFHLLYGHLFSTPDNSNLFRFPLKVRVIGSRLYLFFELLDIWLNISHEIHLFSKWPKRFRLLSNLCLRQSKRSSNLITRVNKYGKKTYSMSKFLNCWGTTSKDKNKQKKNMETSPTQPTRQLLRSRGMHNYFSKEQLPQDTQISLIET